MSKPQRPIQVHSEANRNDRLSLPIPDTNKNVEVIFDGDGDAVIENWPEEHIKVFEGLRWQHTFEITKGARQKYQPGAVAGHNSASTRAYMEDLEVRNGELIQERDEALKRLRDASSVNSALTQESATLQGALQDRERDIGRLTTEFQAKSRLVSELELKVTRLDKQVLEIPELIAREREAVAQRDQQIVALEEKLRTAELASERVPELEALVQAQEQKIAQFEGRIAEMEKATTQKNPQRK